MSLRARTAVAAVVAVITAATGYAGAAAGRQGRIEPLGPDPVTVVVDIEHSRFTPSQLSVRQGTAVRFVVRNADPINHELIVGPDDVHDRHRNGTEAEHGAVPGEVSVPALQRGVTTFTFDEVGVVAMACHLPGHYDYGMRGDITVVPLASTG